ncbi:hypothetical protein BJ508DRAFT_329833 [Ascobolus immersus RN42]|uniref:RNI-like protein n=1 Tax=Ascobolus immersus RN42 TaxID=1160509 RepID=A0A3N4I143_ASCIM|nr:hypothetical protein BJ508DRAFT_329833 [Ascobolus immersus RN42]
MAKLSYVSRKIEGIKLANSVCKDIRKKIPKDVSKATKRVPGTVSDNIEMNLTGRKVGDEGLALICDALLEGLIEGYFRLVELHLSDTAITVAGLRSLSTVIRATSTQLKDLDLSNNQISVASQEDILAWEDFLRSFSGVSSLMRLDLSGNPLGSEFAGETFLRCYSMANPVHVQSSTRKSVGEYASDQRPETEANAHEEGEDHPRFINSGLRSIPFIIFRDLDITDGFALHISYVIEAHLPASTLLALHPSGAKPGTDLHSFIQSVEEDSYGPFCGVMYNPVRSFRTELARKTLDAAVKEVIADSDDDSILEFEDDEGDSSPRFKNKKVQLGDFGVKRCRVKLQGSVLQAGEGTKLVQLWDAAVRLLPATRAIMLTKDNRKLFAKRLEIAAATQRAALAAAMPVFIPPTPKAQQVQQQAPPPPIKSENYESAFPSLGKTPPKKNRPTSKAQATEPSVPVTPLASRNVNKGTNRPANNSKKPSPRAKAPTKVSQSSVEVKEVPKKETITFVVPRNCTLGLLSTFSHPPPVALTEANLAALSTPEPASTTLPALKIETTFSWKDGPPKGLITPLSPLGSSKERLESAAKMWKQILLQAYDPNGLLSYDPNGKLSPDQVENIWNYATNFDTLVMDSGKMRGRRKSDQIWRFLNETDCLTYPIRK